ncbi:MAG: TonB-dependent receptor, partial [Prevotellaceae bacterium]|nr:TonB-dependent receptor [Prevotellaceae bacterium]
DIFNRWTPDNTQTDVPRLQIGYQEANYSSDRFLVRNDAINLKNVTLGYTFPKTWMTRAGLQSLRLFVSADNLWFSSKRQGLDPRQYISGAQEAAAYSPIRTVTFGLNVKF